MKHLTRFTFAVMILAAVLTLQGCSSTAPVIPGAVSSFDSNTYTTLLSVQAAITAATPIATTPAIEKILNDVIAAYNIAEAAYVTYHQAAVAGTATPAMQTALSVQIGTATTAMSQLPSAALQPAATK